MKVSVENDAEKLFNQFVLEQFLGDLESLVQTVSFRDGLETCEGAVEDLRILKSLNFDHFNQHFSLKSIFMSFWKRH